MYSESARRLAAAAAKAGAIQPKKPLVEGPAWTSEAQIPLDRRYYVAHSLSDEDLARAKTQAVARLTRRLSDEDRKRFEYILRDIEMEEAWRVDPENPAVRRRQDELDNATQIDNDEAEFAEYEREQLQEEVEEAEDEEEDETPDPEDQETWITDVMDRAGISREDAIAAWNRRQQTQEFVDEEDEPKFATHPLDTPESPTL